MIGRGGIFSDLRAQMLDAFPDPCKADFGGVRTIGEWIENGAFRVDSCTKKKVILHASSADFANASLIEIENLLNHCLEHFQEMVCYCEDKRERSDAWSAVAAYYLGFFASSVLLRLLGKPVVFIAKSQIENLRSLGGGLVSPGAGAFELALGEHMSATYREIYLVKDDKVHEATWKRALSLINSLNRDANVHKQADEADFYDCLCCRKFSPPGTGFDWPSWVRNRTNYRPGAMYKLRRQDLGIKRCVDVWRTAGEENAFAVMKHVFREAAQDPLNLTNQITMMVNVSIGLFALTSSLYRDISSRRKLDKRWEFARQGYRSRMHLKKTEFAAVF